MDNRRARRSIFPSVETDLRHVGKSPSTPQTRAPAYRLAFVDEDFMRSDDLRGVRLMLELEKPEAALNAAGVDSTVVMFGGARIPPSDAAGAAQPTALASLAKYYAEAERLAERVTRESLARGGRELVIATGGGPGVMEAGNKGAAAAGGRSVGFGIVLPFEHAPNAYVTPDLCFNFHYFATRKMHFLMRAQAITVFPGGFGTLDELFETLTLIQTQRMRRVPILLFGEEFWRRIVNWDALAEAGTISEDDLNLFRYVRTVDEAWDAIAASLDKADPEP